MTAYETLDASGIKFKSWQGAAKYLRQKGFNREKAATAAKKWFDDQRCAGTDPHTGTDAGADTGARAPAH